MSFTLGAVELEIRPEPDDADRAAIEAAVEAATDARERAPAAYSSAWRRMALRESVGEEDVDP